MSASRRSHRAKELLRQCRSTAGALAALVFAPKETRHAPTWPPERETSHDPRAGEPRASTAAPSAADPTQAATMYPGSLDDLAASVDSSGATHLRCVLIEQRLAVISERLELLGERVARLALPTVGESSIPQAVAGLTEPSRVATGVPRPPARQPTVPSASGAALGTLRPPKVPRELVDEAPPEIDAFRPKATRSQPSTRSADPPTPSGMQHLGRHQGHGGPTMTGTVSGLTLTSLFSLIEFERCGGVLIVRNGSHDVELTLRDGSVTRSELDGARVGAVDAVREAFDWQTCTFSFRRDEVAYSEEEPQSVNAVVLEALRHNDERSRVG